MLENIDIKYVIELAKNAGLAILDVYKRDFQVEYKEDESPLTDADRIANEIICKGLSEKYPQIPILSEENKAADYEERKSWEYFWLVDPLDGTKEFINKRDEFTVNIALIEKQKPVLGVVYAPVLEKMYYGSKTGGSWLIEKERDAIKLPIKINDKPDEKLVVIASRSHMSKETQDFIDEIKKTTKKVEVLSAGSSLKLSLIAEGEADVYPRLGPTMEWDTAAAQAIVENCGKQVLRFENAQISETALEYNKENLLNPWFVVK